jgi:hypothetical protein
MNTLSPIRTMTNSRSMRLFGAIAILVLIAVLIYDWLQARAQLMSHKPISASSPIDFAQRESTIVASLALAYLVIQRAINREAAKMLRIAALVAATCASPAAHSQAGLLTVEVFSQKMDSRIKELERSGHSLIDHGNNTAAQQQFLLAGILKSTIDQIETAYAKHMGSTVKSLGNLENEAFDRLYGSIDKVGDLQNKTVADVQDIIVRVQSVSNQLISTLPLTKNEPIFIGIQTRDILSEFDQNPADVRLIAIGLDRAKGYKAPQVTFIGPDNKPQTLPSKAISVFSEKVDIQLPDHLKKSLRFANTVCGPRKTFTIQVKYFFPENKPWWAVWRAPKEESAERTFNALPGNLKFRATVSVSGISTSNVPKEVDFTSTSPQTEWSCEERRNQNAYFYNIPSGAWIVSSQAEWYEPGGRWENKGCDAPTASGSTVTGSCWVQGGNKDLWNCPGGGHGSVRVFGKYAFNAPVETPFSNVPVQSLMLSNRASQGSNITLPAKPGSRYTQVLVKIQRANNNEVCEAAHDEAIVNLSDDAVDTGRVDQTSQRGEFQVTADRKQLLIKRLLPVTAER